MPGTRGRQEWFTQGTWVPEEGCWGVLWHVQNDLEEGHRLTSLHFAYLTTKTSLLFTQIQAVSGFTPETNGHPL